MPVQGDRSLAHVVKARDEVGHRRLAHARRPYQGDDGARRDVEIDASQHPVPRRILKAHVLKSNGALGTACQLDGIWTLCHVRLFV